MKSQFSDMTSSKIFFNNVLFLLSSLVTGQSFMSISSLVLKLWQFPFIRDWPEIRKSEIPVWVLLNIRRLRRIRNNVWHECLEKNVTQRCKMPGLQLFTISKLLRENKRGKLPLPPPRTQIRVNMYFRKSIRFPKQLSSRTPLDGRHSV